MHAAEMVARSPQVGVTAMLIASKYEEIWAPEVGLCAQTAKNVADNCLLLTTAHNVSGMTLSTACCACRAYDTLRCPPRACCASLAM